MVDRVWVDCAICNEEGSMEFRKNQVFTAGKIYIEGLSGYFCRSCSEGFFDSDSKNKINSALSEAKKY
jgi:YgiT-type zinc finger domain-containing protein